MVAHSREARRRSSPFELIGRGVERMLNPAPPRRRRSWLPVVRTSVRPREILIRVDSPELDPRRMHLRLHGRVLTLSGATTDLLSDPPYRAFRRSIVLPRRTDPSRIRARCSDRVMTIRIPTGDGS